LLGTSVSPLTNFVATGSIGNVAEMPTFLVNHNKLRNRSIQLDSVPLQICDQLPARGSLSVPVTSAFKANGTALPRQENQEPSIRHYRSMLVVDAPTIGPLKPLDYSGLYDNDGLSHGTTTSRRLLHHGIFFFDLFCKDCILTEIISQLQVPTFQPLARPSSPTVCRVPLIRSSATNFSLSVASPLSSSINDNKNIVRRKLTGYVGFANLPNQWHRKSVRKGFNFNVMVVGTTWTINAGFG
jgi:septin 7